MNLTETNESQQMMDKKKDLKKSSETHNFMDKLLTKFKMSKHVGEEKAGSPGSGSGSGSGCGSGIGKRLSGSGSSTLGGSEQPGGTLISWDKSKVTADNIMEFSEQLHQLLEYVQSLKDFVFYTYEYPSALNEKLEKEAMELRNLFREVRAAAIDIERLKKQRHLVKKEKCLALKKLDKLREEEIQELESIICAYAKPLHAKWESIKNTQKVDVLENFMNEVTGKHRAIEILQELVRRKLSKISKKTNALPFTLKKNISSTNMNNKIKNQDKPASNWTLSSFPDIDKFGQTIDKMTRGPTDREVYRANRRKRQKELREERRRQNAELNNHASGTNSGTLDLQLVPIEHFPAEEIDDVVSTTTHHSNKAQTPTATVSLSARSPPIVNIEYTSDDDSVSMSSSEFTIESFVPTGSSDVHSDLQNEMRSVLQALFGEIRNIPQIGGFSSTRNRHGNNHDSRSPRTASH